MGLNLGTVNVNLSLLNPDGSALATLILPPVDRHGGLNLTYKDTGKVYTKPNGVPVKVYADPTCKFIPILALKWGVYDGLGKVWTPPGGFGMAHGQTPTLDQLITLLGTYSPYQLAVQPGAGTRSFNCFVSKDIGLTPVAGVVYENVSLELTGTVGLPTMSLS